MDLHTQFTHPSMWRCYQQYRQAGAAHGQMQYAFNLCEEIFTMSLFAKPPNWPQWDHMIENSFELFTSWAIAENPNLANWTVVCNPRDGIISVHHFPLVAVLEAKVFYRIPPNCLPDPLTSSLRSTEGPAVYRLSYFDGGSRSQAPTLSVATDLQMHCSVHGTLKAPIRSQVSVRGDTSLRWLWSIKMAQVENKLRKLKQVVGFPGSSAGKKSAVKQESLVQCLSREDPQEKG